MSALGGPLATVSIMGREFKVTASSDVKRNMGGFTNAVESNGDLSARLLKTPTPWSLGDVEIEIDDDREDQEFLLGIQKMADWVDCAGTWVSGKVYGGTGQIIGDLAASSANASASIELSGPGSLKKLA